MDPNCIDIGPYSPSASYTDHSPYTYNFRKPQPCSVGTAHKVAAL